MIDLFGLFALLAIGTAIVVVVILVFNAGKRSGFLATALAGLLAICLLLFLPMLLFWSMQQPVSRKVEMPMGGHETPLARVDLRSEIGDRIPVPPVVGIDPPIAHFEFDPSVKSHTSPKEPFHPTELSARGSFPDQWDVPADPTLDQPELSVWANTDLQPFSANTYPSTLAAVKPLAREVVEKLDGLKMSAPLDDDIDVDAESESDTGPGQPVKSTDGGDIRRTQVNITGHLLPDAHRDNVLRHFAEQLRFELPDSDVTVFDGSATKPSAQGEIESGTVVLTLSMEDERYEPAPWDIRLQQKSGQHRCDIVTSNGWSNVTSDYVEKPWVEAFDVFVSARPRQRFVVGYSEKFVSSERAAQELAMQDAISKSRVATVAGGSVTADITHVVDRFAQKLSRPYGDVWREAVLLDVSEERMAKVIEHVHMEAMLVQQHNASVILSLLILFGVSMVLCVVLNLLTQGYYRNRLLVTGGAVLTIVFLLVLVTV
jgi:hypothetical protein